MKKTTALVITAIGSIAIFETLRRNGVLDKVKGKVEQKIGRANNDPILEAKGLLHSGTGHVKASLHNISESIHDTIDDLKD